MSTNAPTSVNMHYESGPGKHVDRKIFIIESRIESSNKRDQNQLKIWKKDKRYHVSAKPFDENMAESRKVGELKKEGHYWYVSFVVYTSIIEKGWIDAKFLQGLNQNKWVVIPGFVQNGLTQHGKMDHKKKFHKSLQTMQLLPMYRCMYSSKDDIESRGWFNFCETLLVFEDPDAKDRMRNKRENDILTNACFSALNHAEVLKSVEESIESKAS